MPAFNEILSDPRVLGVLVFVALALSVAAFVVVMLKRRATKPAHHTKTSFNNHIGAVIGPQEGGVNPIEINSPEAENLGGDEAIVNKYFIEDAGMPLF